MDVKLVNPFINAFTAVLPQMGFPTPERTGMSVKEKTINSLGITVLVDFQIKIAPGQFLVVTMDIGGHVVEINIAVE